MTSPTPQRASQAVVAAGGGVFHPERLVAVLGRFKVRYVLIGGVAARLHGFPWLVAIAEITPAPDPSNREALATALKHLSARIFTDGTPEGLPFEISAESLSRAEEWSLITACGRLDIRFRPAGVDGFDALAGRAVQFQIHGDALAVAHLRDIVSMREANATESDRFEVGLLKELLKRQLAEKSASASDTVMP